MMDTRAPLLERLNQLFSRAYNSVAAYMLESEPYVVPADRELLALFKGVADEDARYARAYAGLLDARDRMPQAGAYALWYRDLNYLGVPYLATILIDVLQEDVRLLDAAIQAWPSGEAAAALDLLQAIRGERLASIGRLEKPTAEAQEREGAAYAAERDAARKAREAYAAAHAPQAPARPAPKKAAPKKPAATKAESAPAAELSPKEKARQKILEMRAKQAAATAEPAAASTDTLDPEEEGISKKEKARRQIMRMRAQRKSP